MHTNKFIASILIISFVLTQSNLAFALRAKAPEGDDDARASGMSTAMAGANGLSALLESLVSSIHKPKSGNSNNSDWVIFVRDIQTELRKERISEQDAQQRVLNYFDPKMANLRTFTRTIIEQIRIFTVQTSNASGAAHAVGIEMTIDQAVDEIINLAKKYQEDIEELSINFVSHDGIMTTMSGNWAIPADYETVVEEDSIMSPTLNFKKVVAYVRKFVEESAVDGKVLVVKTIDSITVKSLAASAGTAQAELKLADRQVLVVSADGNVPQDIIQLLTDKDFEGAVDRFVAENIIGKTLAEYEARRQFFDNAYDPVIYINEDGTYSLTSVQLSEPLPVANSIDELKQRVQAWISV